MRYDMTIIDIIPIIETLSHADKLKLLREKVYLYQSDFLRRTILCGILWVWQRGEDADVARHHDEYLYDVK